jgi:hypothetical protein
MAKLKIRRKAQKVAKERQAGAGSVVTKRRKKARRVQRTQKRKARRKSRTSSASLRKRATTIRDWTSCKRPYKVVVVVGKV